MLFDAKFYQFKKNISVLLAVLQVSPQEEGAEFFQPLISSKKSGNVCNFMLDRKFANCHR